MKVSDYADILLKDDRRVSYVQDIENELVSEMAKLAGIKNLTLYFKRRRTWSIAEVAQDLLDKSTKRPRGAQPGNRNAGKGQGYNAHLHIECKSWNKAGWNKAAAKSKMDLTTWVNDRLDQCAREEGIDV